MGAMSRQRRSLLLGLLAAPIGVVGCASAVDAATPPAIEVADGVFMTRGSGGEVDAVNLGRIGNAGFIVGDDGVIAIDTGTSYRHGVALLDTMRRVTERPVRLVLITHARQEFLFGAAAFRERGIPIRMHREAARSMLARCDGCLRTLQRTLGADEMRGTEVVAPDAVFDGSHVLYPIGRPVHVLHYGLSSGPGDIAVLDERSGVLFAGGLLDHGRIPDVQDADIASWQRALAELRRLDPKAIVPGHGDLADARLVATIDRYLTRLQALLLRFIDGGAPLSAIPDAASLPEFEHWDQYATIHRRNASIVFLRLEREQLLR
jgi:glyoxylase-like metal-dependent hydrolase (beta-lactamase superfamily II)